MSNEVYRWLDNSTDSRRTKKIEMNITFTCYTYLSRPNFLWSLLKENESDIGESVQGKGKEHEKSHGNSFFTGGKITAKLVRKLEHQDNHQDWAQERRRRRKKEVLEIICISKVLSFTQVVILVSWATSRSSNNYEHCCCNRKKESEWGKKKKSIIQFLTFPMYISFLWNIL